MAYKFALAASLTLALLNPISAQPWHKSFLESRTNSGINCDGSIKCGDFAGNFGDLLAKVNSIAQGKTFNAGDDLACTGNQMGYNNYGVSMSTYGARSQTGDGLCAMIGHNTPTFTVGPSTNGQQNSAADVIQDLIYHGCKACGTAPTNRQGNNLGDGSIVVDYVQNVCYYTESNACGS